MHRLLVFLTACSAVPEALPDAEPIEGDAATDAAIGRWSVPEAIESLATAADERFPSITAAGRVIYFTRTEMIGDRIVNVPYVASRESIIFEFDEVVRPVAWGSMSIWEQDHHPDHREWFFWRGLGQLARATRPSTEEPWSPPEDLGASGFSPSISRDGLSLYFIDPRGAVAVTRRLDREAPFGPPALVPVAGDLPIGAIDISDDELTLLITADPASPEAGVYLATRGSVDGGFAAPEPIDTLAGPYESARFRADELEIVAVLELSGDRDLYRSHLVK